MAKEVVWSDSAKISFDRVIAYLEKDWTEREVARFVQRTFNVISLIQSGIVTHRQSKKKNTFEVPITKHNLLIYRVGPRYYELLLFYDTRQHPKKKKF
jgi:plasmid stabilization system protein ParE